MMKLRCMWNQILIITDKKMLISKISYIREKVKEISDGHAPLIQRENKTMHAINNSNKLVQELPTLSLFINSES